MFAARHTGSSTSNQAKYAAVSECTAVLALRRIIALACLL